jgi:hypothetical protein
MKMLQRVHHWDQQFDLWLAQRAPRCLRFSHWVAKHIRVLIAAIIIGAVIDVVLVWRAYF